MDVVFIGDVFRKFLLRRNWGRFFFDGQLLAVFKYIKHEKEIANAYGTAHLFIKYLKHEGNRKRIWDAIRLFKQIPHLFQREMPIVTKDLSNWAVNGQDVNPNCWAQVTSFAFFSAGVVTWTAPLLKTCIQWNTKKSTPTGERTV